MCWSLFLRKLQIWRPLMYVQFTSCVYGDILICKRGQIFCYIIHGTQSPYLSWKLQFSAYIKNVSQKFDFKNLTCLYLNWISIFFESLSFIIYFFDNRIRPEENIFLNLNIGRQMVEKKQRLTYLRFFLKNYELVHRINQYKVQTLQIHHRWREVKANEISNQPINIIFQLLNFVTITFDLFFVPLLKWYHVLIALEGQNNSNKNLTKNKKIENNEQHINIQLMPRAKQFGKKQNK